MLLKDVFIRRGIGFLEPKCVVMKGHQTQDREACQDYEFMRGLRLRLGYAIGLWFVLQVILTLYF
jgi:RecQ-mediated genome instability protein 1